jgi:hypothetical protein
VPNARLLAGVRCTYWHWAWDENGHVVVREAAPIVFSFAPLAPGESTFAGELLSQLGSEGDAGAKYRLQAVWLDGTIGENRVTVDGECQPDDTVWILTDQDVAATIVPTT